MLYSDALKQAKKRRAVSIGIYYTHTYFGREKFSAHFFNSAGREVFYFNFIMQGGYPLKPARVWADCYKTLLTWEALC